MFSGIVEAVGTVLRLEPAAGGRSLRISAPFAGALADGDSVAVEGVCLTTTAHGDDWFEVEAIPATLSRTTLGRLETGSSVNLERALALGDRLDGHLVQGHVDGVGEVIGVEREDQQVLVDVRLPPPVSEVTVLHGSIAINGVSLTIQDVPEPDVARVALIPYTFEHTTLRDLRPGDGVNLEGDMLGRFVVNYMKQRGLGRPDEG